MAAGYRFRSRHEARSGAVSSKAADRAEPKDRSDWRLVRCLLLRLLGVVSFVAFVSYGIQIEGLIGSQGLLPVADFLERAEDYVEAEASASRLDFPTLCWWARSDRALQIMAWGGAGLSALLVLGVAPLAVVVALWALYLSLAVAGQTFLSFQWDSLLLETLLVSLFLAPAKTLSIRSGHGPPALAVFLVRFLLFKLMFLSGVVKLLSLDDAWWQLTALDVHYLTQPLPTWTSWYAHQLPTWFQHLSVVVMFVIELVVPFAAFGPRRARLLAILPLVGLQLLIAATGNYGFFNLLTVVLCVSLLDDAALRALCRRLGWRWGDDGPPRARPPGSSRPLQSAASRLRTAALAFVLVASGLTLIREMVRTAPRGRSSADRGAKVVEVALGTLDTALLSWGRPLVLDHTDRFRSINGYGLFRAMTLERPEIVVEVSRDGLSWSEVPFRWKPGATTSRPRFAGPHMPRLDWQMWFAALDPPRAAHWLMPLARALLEGRPAVSRLLAPAVLAENDPPRFVRFQLYDYRFAPPGEKRQLGAWWQRTPLGVLRPGALELDDFPP